MKVCTICKINEPEVFRKRCRDCITKFYSKTLPKTGLVGTPEWTLKMKLKRYTLTSNQYDELMRSQDSKCAICNMVPETICVDHDHVTGKVRGLLCDRCNKGLGFFKDNLTYLESAMHYIATGNKKV